MRLVFVIIFIVLPLVSYAQDAGPINSDRPGQTFNPNTIGKANFQFESSLGFNKLKNDYVRRYGIIQDNLFRHGLYKNIDFELGLSSNQYFQLFNHEASDTINTYHFNNVLLGGRVNLLRESHLLPAIGVRAGILGNIRDFKSADYYGTGSISISKIILPNLALTGNLAYQKGFDGSGNGNYVINLSYGVTDQLVTSFDINKDFNESDFTYTIGAGYFVTPDLLLDVLYKANSNDMVDWSIEGGISYLIRN